MTTDDAAPTERDAEFDRNLESIKNRLIEAGIWDLSRPDLETDARDREFAEWMDNYDEQRVAAQLGELFDEKLISESREAPAADVARQTGSEATERSRDHHG